MYVALKSGKWAQEKPSMPILVLMKGQEVPKCSSQLLAKLIRKL